MKKLRIKGSKEDIVNLGGELLINTDNNVPSGETLWISEDVVDYYQKLYDENPDWFIENNIKYVRILKAEEYARMIRQRYEKYGGEYNAIHIEDRIKVEEELKKINDEKSRIDEAIRRDEMKNIH